MRAGELEFWVMDQFREVFDGVDVVVRRRRDETDAGGGVAGPWRSRKTCGPANSPPSPGWRLGHFDLGVSWPGRGVAGDPKAAGSDLFDAEFFESPSSLVQT